mgnify:CR=1 FL=1
MVRAAVELWTSLEASDFPSIRWEESYIPVPAPSMQEQENVGRQQTYRANKAKWTADSAEAKAVAKWTKAEVKDVPPTMALYTFPTLAEQAKDAAKYAEARAEIAEALVRVALDPAQIESRRQQMSLGQR